MAGKGMGAGWKSRGSGRNLAPAGRLWPGRDAGHPLWLSGVAHGSWEPLAVAGPLLLPANAAHAQLPTEQIFSVLQLSAKRARHHETAAASTDVGLGAKLSLWVQDPFLPGLGRRWEICTAKCPLVAPAAAQGGCTCSSQLPTTTKPQNQDRNVATAMGNAAAADLSEQLGSFKCCSLKPSEIRHNGDGSCCQASLNKARPQGESSSELCVGPRNVPLRNEQAAKGAGGWARGLVSIARVYSVHPSPSHPRAARLPEAGDKLAGRRFPGALRGLRPPNLLL